MSSATTSTTFSGVISGPLSLVKAGGGTSQLTLTGVNTYTGSTTVTGGILAIGNSTAAGSIATSSAVKVGSGGQLTLVNVTGSNFTNNVANGLGGVGLVNFSSAATMTVSGALTDGASGQLALNQSGTGTTILTNTSTYTGATGVSGGTLQIGNGAAGNITGTSGVTVGTAGALALDLADGSTFSPDVVVNGSGIFKAIQSGTTTVTSLISGAGSFNQNGTGTTILTHTETYLGDDQYQCGHLEVDGSLATASTVNVTTAGALTGAGTINGNAILTGNGIIHFGSAGRIAGTLGVTGGNWNGVGTVNGLVTSSSGAFNINGNLTAASGLAFTGGSIGGSGTLTGSFNDSNSLNSTLGVTIAGTGSALTMSGKGVLTLTANNTYTGATTVSGGTLQIGNGTAGNLLGSSGVTVSGTAILVIDLADGATLAPNINLSVAGVTLKAIQAGTNTLSGVISGAAAFNQIGTGTTILTNAETYTGATNVNAGTLEVDGSLVSSSTVVATAGTLSGTGTLNGNATLTGNGIINFGSGQQDRRHPRHHGRQLERLGHGQRPGDFQHRQFQHQWQSHGAPGVDGVRRNDCGDRYADRPPELHQQFRAARWVFRLPERVRHSRSTTAVRRSR